MKKLSGNRIFALLIAMLLAFGMMPQVTFEAFAADTGGLKQAGTQATIQIGETKLVENGEVTGNSVYGIDVEKSGNDYNLTLNGYNHSDQTLVLDTEEHVFVRLSGENALKKITLGKNAKFEADADGDCSLEVKDGIGGTGEQYEASLVKLSNSIILKIGSSTAYADKGIYYVQQVDFYNYDFHKRDLVNDYIYAHKAFSNVDEVVVSSAKVELSGQNSTTDSIAATETECYVTAEGQVAFKNAKLDNLKLISRYYATYPQSPISEPVDHYDMSAYQTTYELTSNTENSSSTDNKYTYTYSSGNGLFTSLDPILYSVSYQVDEDIAFPNSDKGSVRMKGFEKGYYVEDGTSGKFEAWIAEGETVTVEIMPDQGYQYQKDTLNINGTIIENATPAEATATYTFTMPANAGHICAGFAKTEDMVEVETDAIKAASIDNTDQVIENGNAKLEIETESVDAAEKAELEAEAPNLELAEVLDIDLSESIVKNYDPAAKENDSWDEELHELTDSVEVSVTLSDSLVGAEEYSVVREHEGETEVIESEYDSASNQLTFETDKFSTYAIFKGQQVAQPSRYVLSATKYTYDGKVKTPTLKIYDKAGKLIGASNYTIAKASGRKNVGKYTYKVTFKGNYRGTKTLSFVINPKGTTLSKLTATKGGFKASWKKQATQTTGYQLQYSTSSKFTSAKTVTVSKNKTLSRSISKLKKGKKYYVRVRTYKTVSGNKYYSTWSKVKYVKTKK